ncbi:MAG: DUF2059 domain-containing protein [Rubrivivax sp.]
MSRMILSALLLAATALAHAQSTPTPAQPAALPSSPAKKELVNKLLTLQQPGLEQAARSLVERPAAQMLQEAGRYMQAQVPADRREALGKTIDADVKRYVDESVPLVRDKAIKLAPSTLGAALEQNFNEDELKQLVAWYESPVNKKFQQVSPEMQSNFLQQLVTESRPVIEPKLQALQQQVRTVLTPPAAPVAPAAPSAATPPKPPARPASR